MDILDKIPKKNEELAWRVIDSETIVIDLDRQPEEGEELQVLNETASRIWELIDGENNVKNIINKIIKVYDVKPKEADSEVKKLIHELVNKKFVTI